MKIIYQRTKTLDTKLNTNSANCIAPNLIYGCVGSCDCYCYMKRYNPDKLYINTNVMEIFDSVCQWEKHYQKIPDQQDPIYKMVDISCNTDLVLHQKHLPIDLIQYLKMYDDHPTLNSTMATKYSHLLRLDVNHFNKKPRIRISLMPQDFSSILEPKMQKISSRIEDYNRLEDLGWEVHLNFSPVIVYDDWLEKYYSLFDEVYKKIGCNIKSEVIFLTNHEFSKRLGNQEQLKIMSLSNQLKNNKGVMRYNLEDKRNYIQQFKEIYSNFFNLQTIRYIF